MCVSIEWEGNITFYTINGGQQWDEDFNVIETDK